MGWNFRSIHIKSDDIVAVCSALDSLLGNATAEVAPPANGWISVYPESDGDDVKRLAHEISDRLGSVTFAIRVHDDDGEFYWLFDSGDLVDELESLHEDRPQMRGRAARTGRPDILARYASGHVDPEDFAALLGKMRSLGISPEQRELMDKLRALTRRASTESQGNELEFAARMSESKEQADLLARLKELDEPHDIELMARVGKLLGIPEERTSERLRRTQDLRRVPGRVVAQRRARTDEHAHRLSAWRNAQVARGDLLWCRYPVWDLRFPQPLEMLWPYEFDHQGRLWLQAPRSSPAEPLSARALDGDTGQALPDQVDPHFLRELREGEVSPDGTLYAWRRDDGMRGTITIERRSDRLVVGTLAVGVGTMLWFTPGSDRLFTCDGHTLAVFALPGLRELTRVPWTSGHDRRVCNLSPDGSYFIRPGDGVDPFAPAMTIFDAHTLAPLRDVHFAGASPSPWVQTRMFSVVYACDGRRVFVATEGLGLLIVDALTGDVEREVIDETPAREGPFEPILAAGGRGVFGLVVEPSGRWVAATTSDGFLRFYDPSFWVPIMTCETGIRHPRIIVDPSYERLLLWDDAPGSPLLCWRTPTHRASRSFPLSHPLPR